MHLRLIRHGETVANREGRMQGQSDFPLSPEGKQQAQLLAEWLADDQIDALYSSDLSRAYDTALVIARYHDLSVQTREDLREIKLGRFEKLTASDIKQKYPAYFQTDLLSCGLEDVEQAEQVYQRALSVVDDLLQRHFGERVVVVSHGTFIGCMLMALLGIKWPGKRIFSVGNTSITTIDFRTEKQFMILGVNEQPHLQVNQVINQKLGAG
ncbi:broad specificity phosphatase PhoE [Caldalkalibacillus uzonensis]|uniref:Broad specificity phosphatase PhoE n=1 Tax=Caldalkalibacillus uzonensis TaxID=353224 RepID=A0ABU0CXH7_9BACI|nr:histidine phosphatase family protein [Caldalkalibacillus uzonensis]MDQ0340067.1 broad specificity phosphatase PhoE [Caldalkalibacillus uzonensis]